MIKDEQCGVNRLFCFAPFLQRHLGFARAEVSKDGEVYKAMKGLRQILTSGLPLERVDQDWAWEEGIEITVSLSNTFFIVRNVDQLLLF